MNSIKKREITIHKPLKKINFYTSAVKENNKNIKLKINNVKFINIIKNNSDNEILRIYINNNETKDELNIIDREILESAIKNNNIWFNNNLTNEGISEYFRESYNNKNSVISLLVSEIKLPVIHYNDKTIEDLKEVKIDNTHIINIEIECEGIYFYKDKFGLRWIVRLINIYDSDKYINFDEIVATKEEIEEEWDNTIKEFEIYINQECDKLKNKLTILDEFKKEIIGTYKETKNITTADNFWNNSFIKISKQISKYYNGTLKL
jgi:hypothetical protein